MSFEIETLLQPIAEENPAGEWLRYEGTYDRILEARREDDESLPQGVWQKKAKRANFAEVTTLCVDALRSRTKDLQIAAYLTEAQMQLHGPSGAALGLQLMAALCRTFWTTLYPLLDGDDTSFRLTPFDWLDQKLPILLRLFPLANPADDPRHKYSYADWERALRSGSKPSPNFGADKESEPTQEKISAAVDRTAQATLAETVQKLHELGAAVQAVDATINELLAHDSGTLVQTRQLLEKMLGFLKPWSDKLTPANSPAEAARTAGPEMSSSAPGTAPSSAPPTASPSEFGMSPDGVIKSRAMAYQLINQIADYLLRTEPHSPTGYLLKRAVRWGDLPLHQLLAELVSQESELSAIYGLLGMHKAPEAK